MRGGWLLGAKLRVMVLLSFSCGVSLSAGAFSQPELVVAVLPNLDELIPVQFGDWQEQKLAFVIGPAELNEEDGTATLYRAYHNKDGVVVTLVVAYGAARGDNVRLHQPAVCYRAQGYDVQAMSPVQMAGLRAARMTARRGASEDQVTYWLRTGDQITDNQVGQQWANLKAGLGRSTDSVLVRVSTSRTQIVDGYSLQRSFVMDLLASVNEPTREFLTASPQGGKAWKTIN